MEISLTLALLVGGVGASPVQAQNQAPSAANDRFAANTGETLMVDAPGVLANDSDPDGDALTASVVNGPSNGSLTLEPDGSFEYTSASDFAGPDTLEYEVADGNGGTDQARVIITVVEVAIPAITVSTDAGDSQDLFVGLDPAATDAIDPALGEEELPPVPPGDIFDARLLDGNVEAGPFGEGLAVDIRNGSFEFNGTKQHEIGFKNVSGVDSVSISWDLPVGVTGTIEDVFGGAVYGPKDMVGSGSITVADGDPNAIVTLDYTSANTPPQVVNPIPDDTLLTPGPPLQLTGLAQTVFSDPDGDSLAVSGTSLNTGVLTVSGEGPVLTLHTTMQTGNADVVVTASDGQASVSDTFNVEVEERPPGQQEPASRARSVVPPGDSSAVGFGNTGVGANFRGVGQGGTVEVSFFPDSTSESPGAGQAFVSVDAADTFDNVSRYRWNISNEGITFDSVDVAFVLSNPDVVGIGEPDAVTIIKDSGGDGNFEAVPTTFDDRGTPSDSTDDVLIGEGIEGFSTFKFASNDSDNPLPVELTEFTARLNDGAALLQWRTASETNNAGFEVQHKDPDAQSYSEAGFVESNVEKGTSSEPTTYQFEVTDLAPGTHQFRLRQVDTDGTSQLSKTTSVTVQLQGELRLTSPMPNPVRSKAQLRFGVKEAGEATVRLYNVLGQQVATLYEGTPPPGEMQNLQLDSAQLASLPSGVYFVRLKANGGIRSRRMVVVR